MTELVRVVLNIVRDYPEMFRKPLPTTTITTPPPLAKPTVESIRAEWRLGQRINRMRIKEIRLEERRKRMEIRRHTRQMGAILKKAFECYGKRWGMYKLESYVRCFTVR